MNKKIIAILMTIATASGLSARCYDASGNKISCRNNTECYDRNGNSISCSRGHAHHVAGRAVEGAGDTAANILTLGGHNRRKQANSEKCVHGRYAPKCRICREERTNDKRAEKNANMEQPMMEDNMMEADDYMMNDSRMMEDEDMME